MSQLSPFLEALRAAFGDGRDKYAAHERSTPILQDLAASPEAFTEILMRHLALPDALTRMHYPVVSFDIEANMYFGLVANCWIPRLGGGTNLSTKAIHHHGQMLLTTVTAFGPGYEHWLFTTPTVLDKATEMYTMGLVERVLHPTGHASFVDANAAHVPFFPPSLSITFALWSSCQPTSWKDSLKHVPALHKHSGKLRRIAATIGFTRALDLNVPEYFDFFPTPEGFRGMKDRKEFERGPNEDYLYSLFHVIQGTLNEEVGQAIGSQLDVTPAQNRAIVERLLDDLASGRPITGRLSPGHSDVSFANFPGEPIERALDACAARLSVPSP